MSWREIGTRSRQGMDKRLDSLRYAFGVEFTTTRAKLPLRSAPRFFFMPEELASRATLIQEKLPADARETIEAADRILQHRFDLLGYRSVDYGRKIDWHLDAVHGKRTPRKPWFKIGFRFEDVGDPKVTWELNRHQHLVTLAKAYRFTNDTKYVDELVGQWRDWLQENPYPIGINWASSLEVAFRSLSWLWVRHLITGCPRVPASFEADLLHALAFSGTYIRKYLSTYYAPNTHLIGEAVGLFFIGTLCPELAHASRWQQVGWQILLREADRQVQADGMHFEQSVYYHVYALDFFLHARILAAYNQMAIPEAFDKTLVKMLEVLRVLGQGGLPPRFGDDDGGRVFNPARNRAEHMLDPLATGAGVFKRADFKAAARGLREETIWLLGADGVAEFDNLPSDEPSLKSIRFEPSGICVMTDQGAGSTRLVLDAGPQGYGPAGHGHADALSFSLVIQGEEWLSDPGTYRYSSAGEDRKWFRGTAFHNTLQVEGLDQAEPASPFAWRALPEVRVEKWIAGETFDLFKGSHDGYRRLPDPVVHRRWVFNLKSRFFLVCDLALGKGKHQLDSFWHFAPGIHGASPSAESATHWNRNGQNLSVLAVQGEGWKQEVVEGRYSPAYGKEEPAPVLHFSTMAELPREFAVIIRPDELQAESPRVLVRMMPDPADLRVLAYRLDIGDERHIFFMSEPGEKWSLGPWASDADFLYCGIGPREQIQLILSGGSYFETAGARVVSCSRAVERLELTWSEGVLRQSCSDAEAVESVSEHVIADALTSLRT